MADNITITIAKDDKNDIITTNSYILIYHTGNGNFKPIGNLDIKDLAPMLIKIAMQKMANKE